MRQHFRRGDEKRFRHFCLLCSGQRLAVANAGGQRPLLQDRGKRIKETTAWGTVDFRLDGWEAGVLGSPLYETGTFFQTPFSCFQL